MFSAVCYGCAGIKDIILTHDMYYIILFLIRDITDLSFINILQALKKQNPVMIILFTAEYKGERHV